MKSQRICLVMLLALTAAATAHAQADPAACKTWKKEFAEAAAEAKAASAKLKPYLPKGKDPETVAQWKANVDEATFSKIAPIVKRRDDAQARGKRLFQAMHRGRCPV